MSAASDLTFMLTDVEGSVGHWESDAAGMSAALAFHDALVARIVAAHGGSVFKNVGDAVFAVFPAPADAAAAAVAVQQALDEASWPSDRRLRVRIGLHTGPAEARDSDYFGPTLNRAARIVAAGHGGQILCSQAVRDRLPASVETQSLGVFQLAGFGDPDPIHQLRALGLAADFPPLRAVSALAPGRVAGAATSLFGREAELAATERAFGEDRLVTYVGTGGVGKTRLALAVADREPGPVWFVDLSPLGDPALVASVVLQGVGAPPEKGGSAEDVLVARLAEAPGLLVLDNCEHLIDAAARLADRLIAETPARILATSREPLGLESERLIRVGSLTLPSGDDLVHVAQSPATALFVSRAERAEPTFRLTPTNAALVAQLCRRLDGIPLALELAAARLSALSLEQIVARLDDRFRLLSGGPRLATPRHRTLEAVFDWSYDLLAEDERRLLESVSVFLGGWDLEAAVAVARMDEYQVIEGLESLVAKSLVLWDPEKRRYSLLESVRQYAADRLRASGQTEPVRDRHLDFFTSLAERSRPHLSGPEQAVWFDRLRQEEENLRVALAFGSSAPDSEARALRTVAVVWRYWYVRGLGGESTVRIRAALDATPDDPRHHVARTQALRGLAWLEYLQGHIGTGEAAAREALAITRQIDDPREQASTHNLLAGLAGWRGDFDEADAHYVEALALFRALGDAANVGRALQNQGMNELGRGDFERAEGLLTAALGDFEQIGEPLGIAWTLYSLSQAAAGRGDLALARERIERSLTMRRELGDARGIAYSLQLQARLGASEDARADLRDALARFVELDEESGMLYAALAVAAVGEADDPERSAALAAWARAVAGRLNLTVPAWESGSAAAMRERLAARLGDAALAQAEARGVAWSQGDVVRECARALERDPDASEG